jgi:hypothetical protein
VNSPQQTSRLSDVPAGTPAWVTPELIDQTIRVWQPYYREPLKPEDALAMILGVAELHRVIGEGAGA